jgi:hypothetical protein
MSALNPVGSCCSRPRFHAVGGIDDRTWTSKLKGNNLPIGARKVGRTVGIAVVLAALVIIFACVILQIAD